MFDVACVGIIVADNNVHGVTRIPSPGKLELVEELKLYTGGCAVNTGIDLAKMGLSVAVLGKVGNDGYGNFMIAELNKACVNTEGVCQDERCQTSSSVVLVNQDGERSFLHCLGANAEFIEEDINYQIIEKSKMVFVAGTMLMPKFDGEPCAKFLQKVKQMGKVTALDTAWDSQGRWMSVLRNCLPFIDYFMPSYEEAVELSKETEPEKIADVFLNLGVKVCVVKLGKDGCFIKDGKSGEKYLMPTYRNIKPVDTNGAGDSFCAGFLAGIAKGWRLESCGQFANAVGTHCIMAPGASTGIKPMEEILEFMKNNKAGD